jgi:hypothetical protein
MKFLELIRLDIVHDYYSDGLCPDFQLEPTPETGKLLRDCRGVIRSIPGGIRILVPTDQGVLFIPLPPKPVFAFQLRLENPNFVLFTDLAEINKTVAPLYTNSGQSKELSLVSREARSTENFVVQQPSKKEAFVLSGHPLPDLKTAAFVIKGLGQKSPHEHYDKGARAVVVDTSPAKPGTPFTITYPIAAKLKQGVFADVEIRYEGNPAKLAEAASQFRIVFKTKEARWKYYIVTDKTNNKADALALEDKDKVIVFKAEDRTDLTKTPDPADNIAAELARQYPNMHYFRFVSDSLVPCQKAARKTIQFQLNGEKVIDALPNPALENYSIDARNATQEYTLYQIVKYFTH